MTVPVGPFGTMPQEPWHPGKAAKSDQVMQLNCVKVITQPEHERRNKNDSPSRQTIAPSK